MSEKKFYSSLILRYATLVLVAIPNLYIFYFVFTPLTTYPVNFILNLFVPTYLSPGEILMESVLIQLIPACIAGSAYYLLLVLNLTTPQIKKRGSAILFSFSSLLILNILRIVALSFLFYFNSDWFNFTHKISWYFLSVFFVMLIWFFEVKIFKIKSVPFFSDLKNLIKNIKN